MKLNRLFALAALATVASGPAFATSFLVDFEKNWDYLNGDVNGYYSGGTAADSSTGTNLGVSFSGVSGLSNNSPFTYYSGAPSMLGVAYAYDVAFMNVAAGVNRGLAFFYSSPVDIIGAVQAYSGLNGTGTLLGSFDLTATGGSFNSDGSYAYDAWKRVTFSFGGTAQSFDLTASANQVVFDNIGTVPELDAGGATGALVLLAGILSLISERRHRT